MNSRNDQLKNAMVKIGFLIVLLTITSYRSKEDVKNESTKIQEGSKFTFKPDPIFINAALRRIAYKIQ